MDPEAKQVIVARKDLNMRKGKLAAQVAHAAMGVLLAQMNKTGNYWALELTPGSPLHAWLTGRFKKIVVGVNSESELLALHEQAKAAGLLCCLIQDSGLTEFGGVPTYTTLAIGPTLPADLDPLTGTLSLL